ncbi:hypothetical protein [Actinokineospora globicatena]|uniref:hypothetical protein n=1 Tax=Actinokineospora globicatena TaxID=103729 RepID=UPI0020A397C0|nr:hypothetical protein [Actinokineospora globicatena]MCP2306772.1 hypothetical protein [Actinokineospora globicatena]GLW82108.1 hypothetical protein Aglo01_65890 [Actinokineospora globicatena]GLW88901.1 hypothetical protein Aglo02_65400 [Actinokineospora globicatena]
MAHDPTARRPLRLLAVVGALAMLPLLAACGDDDDDDGDDDDSLRSTARPAAVLVIAD